MSKIYPYLLAFFLVCFFEIAVLKAQPIINSFSPGSGPVNTVVTITGNNFVPLPASNIVYFGAVRGNVLTASVNALTVKVPFGANFLPLTVTVNGLTAYAEKPFVVTYTYCGIPQASFEPYEEGSIGGNTWHINVCDFNADGKADIIANIGGQFAIERNVSTPGNINFSSFFINADVGSELGIGDFNGDGKYDIAAPAGLGISVFKNTSVGSNISFGQNFNYTSEYVATSATVGDLDGDGRPDIAVACRIPNVISTLPCKMAIFRNIGTGSNISFGPELVYTTGIDPMKPIIRDINADGKPDLLFANYNSFSFSYFLNTSVPGNISFAERVNISTSDYYPTDIAVGDFNGDGRPDIAVACYNGATIYGYLAVYKNISLSLPAFDPPFFHQTLSGNRELVLGDVDGDGKIDMVTSSLTMDKIVVHLNNSIGSGIAFTSGTQINTGHWPISLAMIDLDNDGKPDFATGSNINSMLGTLRNIGPEAPQFSASAVSSSCNSNNGSITVNVSSGLAPFEYRLNTGPFQPSASFLGLQAGQYLVTVRDANDCFDTLNITVTNANAPQITAVAAATTCGNSNGSIQANGSGGSGPFQYSIDGTNFQSTGNFSGLAAGAYTVTVKDNNNCRAFTTITVNDIAGPQLTTAIVQPTCMNGSITALCSGGTAPYMYSINSPTAFQSSGMFPALSPGNYLVRGKDANGCIISEPVTLQSHPPIVTATTTTAGCNMNDGSLAPSGTDGTPPYTYSLDGTNYLSTNIFSNLPAAMYILSIKDNTGCINSTVVTINSACFSVTATQTASTCGLNNAAIQITAINGVLPYSYSLNGIDFQGNSSFQDLYAGQYLVTVKDASGAPETASIIVTDIPGPQLVNIAVTDATCGNNDGTVSITATSTSFPLQYSMGGNSFQAGNYFGGLSQGNYTIIVKDDNGCISTQPASVGLINNITVSTGSDLTICEGSGTILPAITNGTAFSWQPAASVNDPALLHPVAHPIVTTTYSITSSTGSCNAYANVKVIVNPAPVPLAGRDTGICFGKNIQLHGSGGISYSWQPSAFLSNAAIADPVVVSPSPGLLTYQLLVEDIHGCKSIQPAFVRIDVRSLEISLGRDTVIAMNQPLHLFVNGINNTGALQYTWQPSYGLNDAFIRTPVATLDRDITYTVSAETSDGCKGKDEINIRVYKGPEIYVAGAFTPNADMINNFLRVLPVGMKGFNYFAIYNRWGLRVFLTRNPATGWDGNFNGISQAPGTYVWEAEAVDLRGNKIIRKGTVVLIR